MTFWLLYVAAAALGVGIIRFYRQYRDRGR